MKYKLVIWLLLLAIVPMCLAYWLSPGYNKQHEEVAAPLCFLLAFAFSFSKLSTRKVCIIIFCGMMIAKIIKISIDIQNDPTSHNLLPFELAIYGVILSFFILIGAGLGKLYLFIKMAIAKHKQNKLQQ